MDDLEGLDRREKRHCEGRPARRRRGELRLRVLQPSGLPVTSPKSHFKLIAWNVGTSRSRTSDWICCSIGRIPIPHMLLQPIRKPPRPYLALSSFPTANFCPIKLEHDRSMIAPFGEPPQNKNNNGNKVLQDNSALEILASLQRTTPTVGASSKRLALHCWQQSQAMLSEVEAIEIYRAKIAVQTEIAASYPQNIKNLRSILRMGSSRRLIELSEKYGVNPRTIRDLWNRKTWAYATIFLWPEEHYLKLHSVQDANQVIKQYCEFFGALTDHVRIRF